MPSKPFGVCWCDCHKPTDENGRRSFDVATDANHVNGWPRFDYAVAALAACTNCKGDHEYFAMTGQDPFYKTQPRGRIT